MYDTPLVIFFEGEAEGGTVSLNVLRAVGEDLAVETFTKAGERPRQVVNRLADLLEEAGLERVVELDHAQETLVLNSALDVDLAIEDEGLLAAFQFADEALEIDNTSFSGLSQPYGETTDGDASDPDAAVLQSLASYVGHLADQGEISSDLRERLNLTQALYMEVLGVLTQRKTEISLPNPGEGVPLATTNAAVQGVADQLAGHVPAMLKGSADLSDARGKQMDAIEKKEREAKQGGGGGVGGEGGDKGKGEGGDGQDDTTQNKKPEIGEASPGAPAGQGAGSAGKVGVRRAGTDDPLAEHIAAEEILHVTGRGLDLVIARIGDEWYAAKGRVNKEFKLADGKTVIRPEWDLGSFDKDAPPEAKPIKIDFEKLQEFIKKANDAARKPDDGGTSVAKVISIALDFVPVIGDIKGAAETLLGYNLLTNEKLSTTERALGGALLLLPFFGRLIKGASKVGLHTAARLADTGGEIAEQGLRNLDEFAEAIVKTRRADSADASVRTVTRNADNVDEARHLPGASATRGKCFKVGTPVVRADGTLVPIENLVPGDEILAAADAADAPSLASMVPARVSTAIRQTVHRGVQISFTRDGNGETDDVTCTPRHPIATERGYVSAEDLQPDDRLLLAEGTATLSKLEPVTTAFEVIKLEVEAHHCFFVSALRLLVHNWCEGMAQPHLESELDDICTPFRHPETGEIIREPAFRGNEFLGVGKQMEFDEVCDRLGIVGSPGNTRVSQRNEMLRDSTSPDYLGDLTQSWGDLPAGTTVSVEMKSFRRQVTKSGKVVEGDMLSQLQHLVHHKGRSNKGGFFSQAGMRVTQTPGEHVLFLDITHAEGFMRSAPVADHAASALATLGQSLRQVPELTNIHQAYSRVAFLVRGPGGTFRRTDLFPMPGS